MVDKSLITPLYEQVANELRKEILCGQYGEYGAIGTHQELARRFSVSLITIRNAVKILEEEGLVKIRQGKGTFVHRTALVDHLHNLTGISNIMSNLKVKTDITVPAFEVIRTPDWIDEEIREGLGENTLFIRRNVSVGGKPMACAELYLPGKFIGLFTKADVEKNTVYQIYQRKLGITLGRGKQIICAAGARGEVAKSLGIPENWPILKIERKAYDDNKNLIEFMVLSYEASKYAFEVELELSKE